MAKRNDLEITRGSTHRVNWYLKFQWRKALAAHLISWLSTCKKLVNNA